MVKMETKHGQAFYDSMKALFDSYRSFESRRQQMQDRLEEVRREAEALKARIVSATDTEEAERIAKEYREAKDRAEDMELLLAVNSRAALNVKIHENHGEAEAAEEYRALKAAITTDNARIQAEAQERLNANNAALRSHPYQLGRKLKSSIQQTSIGN